MIASSQKVDKIHFLDPKNRLNSQPFDNRCIYKAKRLSFCEFLIDLSWLVETGFIGYNRLSFDFGVLEEGDVQAIK